MMSSMMSSLRVGDAAACAEACVAVRGRLLDRARLQQSPPAWPALTIGHTSSGTWTLSAGAAEIARVGGETRAVVTWE